jgi:hypothetical protein
MPPSNEAAWLSYEKPTYRSDLLPMTRPETHQNLIHTDKEQMLLPPKALALNDSSTTDQPSPPPRGVKAQKVRTDCFSVMIPVQRHAPGPNSESLTKQAKADEPPSAIGSQDATKDWWRRTGSNR